MDNRKGKHNTSPGSSSPNPKLLYVVKDDYENELADYPGHDTILAMSRVINTNTPGKVRNRNRRTVAELLRRLSKKQTIDDEARDMLATIVFELAEIWDGVEKTSQAWEKRGYWMKADRFIREWEWTREISANLDDILRHEAWDLVPEIMADCYPRFADIEIKTMTRNADTWQEAYARLMQAEPLPLPY